MLTGDVFGSPAQHSVADTRNMDHADEDVVVQGSDEEHEFYDEEDEEPYNTDEEEDDGNNTSDNSDLEEDSVATETEYLAPEASAHDFLCFIAQPGRPRFTTVANTAGFMRVVVSTGTTAADHPEIIVHYHCTRFCGARLDTRQVTVCSGTKLHRVRFVVPSGSMAVDPASTLRLVGAALVAMVYPPGDSRNELDALWLDLVAAAPVIIPSSGVTRVEVTVDAGILRREDYTAERVARMLKALPAVARKADEWDRAIGDDGSVVVRLPTPVRREDDHDRPAKRRKFAEEAEEEEEECAICCEVMVMEKRGLAAWPQCDHVFHGLCLERLLFRGDQRCPLCRSELAVAVVLDSSCS